MGRLDEWRFCPRCGSVARPEPEHLLCPACGYETWANSAATASAFIEDEQGRLLLGRRALEPFKGLWDTPGGFLQEGEHPLDALLREVKEETGLDGEAGAYVGTWMDTYGPPGRGVLHTLNLFWRVHVPAGGPAPVPADDVAELAWFAADALPPREEIAFACVPLALEAWRTLKEREGGAAGS